MKREIKFRGKSTDTGKWVYGFLSFFYTAGRDENGLIFTDKARIYSPEDGCCYDVWAETVGQFTGLKDKEGNDIYEGDIVKWDDMSGGKYWRFAVVRIGPDIMFDCSPVKSVCGVPNSTDYVFQYGRFQYQLTHNFLTVIGNIHESDTDILTYSHS